MRNVIALGAQNKTTFSVISEKGIFTGTPVEDMSDIASYKCFETELGTYMKENDINPDIVVCDMHPDYNSAVMAVEMYKGNKAQVVKMQHHFAHIVACMYDNGLDERVIGVSFDGTGFGDDGLSWGGEFLVCDRSEYERRYHLKYVPQPGGDIASREGWRMALAYLYEAFGDGIEDIDTPLLRRIDEKKISVIRQMINMDINSPMTSSMGRLFDAVSSLAGICDTSSFEAEGAILLEKEAAQGITGSYDICLENREIIVSKMIREIVSDISSGVSKGEISAKFHNTVGDIIVNASGDISSDTGLNKVLVSGGCFQNRYLVEYIEKKFESTGLELYKHKRYSPTDLGISIGQAIYAKSSF